MILDRYRSYIIPEFDLFYKDHCIIILCILLYLLYLLQPLNINCFAGLKYLYRQQIENLIQVGVNYIDKSDFLLAYFTACTEALTSNIVCNRFAAAGLVLYNPEYIFSKLNTQLQIPIPPPPPAIQQVS